MPDQTSIRDVVLFQKDRVGNFDGTIWDTASERVLACDIGLASYLASTGADINAVNWALKKYSAGSPCTPEIKNVWWQDRWKFKQHLGLTDNQIAAICPLASK